MTISPSHLYALQGREKGVAEEVIQASLAAARRTQKYGIPTILTLRHLAYLTEADYGFLRGVVSRTNPDLYKTFTIRKRAGGRRVICVPLLSLKLVQVWLHRNALSRVKPHWRSFAYTPGSSAAACASEHCGCAWLIKIDIESFFESVTERSVYRVFRSLGYAPLISFEMARLCTREGQGGQSHLELPYDNIGKYKIKPYRSKFMGSLPQGASTSPMLANLACWNLDEELSSAAESEGLVYTRYADDLTFSTVETGFDRKRAGKVIQRACRILEKHGFAANQAKTKVIPPGARKVVLGLLVDGERPRLTKQFRKRLEHHARGVRKFGPACHAAHHNFDAVFGFRRHISGLLAYARTVDVEFAEALQQEFLEAFEDR